MTATNHALTGACIGLSLGNPWLALPTAFVSHFVLDAIPHFGFKGRKTDAEWLPDKRLRVMLAVEALCCFAIVLLLFLAKPHAWFLAAVCAFVAASPDLYSLPRFLYYNKLTKNEVKWNAFRRFHQAIQHESVWGAAVEVAWFFGVLTILATKI
ncbi:hypothetical protein IPL68_07495 [Candidatus Saccharibacteria bacterium]|nr:MAG: hypothetical protein IPL68_07495 [Candidatus Saccharibacteria bacterium]